MLFLLTNALPWPSFFLRFRAQFPKNDTKNYFFMTYFLQLLRKRSLPIPHFYPISVCPFLISICWYLFYVICIINVFHSVNLALNTVTSIHSIQKSVKIWSESEKQDLKLVSAIFHHFWKNNVIGYFERNTLKRNLTYSCFFPLFHEHVFSSELPRVACLLKTFCFEKMTLCVTETMVVTYSLVQMNKARRKENQKIKHKLR